MAAVKIKSYSHGVLVIANDLLNGHTVYFSNTQQWLAFADLQLDQAEVAYSEEEAEKILDVAKSKGSLSPVIDPYIIELNDKGEPSHSREMLRATGPSISFGVPNTIDARDAIELGDNNVSI